jgi:hypothetical protein
MTKRTSMIALCAGVLLGTANADAAANQWTSYFTMDYIDTTSYSGAGDGYSISGPGDFTGGLSNPAGCTGNLAYAYPSNTEIPAGAARELVARTVLAAYLAGKQVRLMMSGTKCTGTGTAGAPTYISVAVD